MKKCPKCDFESDTDQVCPNCGTRLSEIEDSNTAEKTNKATSSEIESDGALEPPTGEPVKADSSEKRNSKTPKLSKKKKIIIIVIVAVIVLISLIGSCAGTNDSTNSSSYSSSQSMSKTPASQADKEELKKEIDKYKEEIDTSEYTASSITAFAEALAKGQSVYDNENATQSEVQNALSAIRSAYNQLVKRTKPATFTGNGDDIIDVPSDLSTAIVTAKNEGSRNFVVKALDSSMDSVDLLVNTIGAYEGTTMIGTKPATVSHLEINSSGKWSITISPLEDTPSASNGKSYKGDQVLFLRASDAKKLTFTNSGKSNFVVKGITDSGSINLLVNDIGDYTGTVVNKNYIMLIVTSSGTWSVSW